MINDKTVAKHVTSKYILSMSEIKTRKAEGISIPIILA
jgi:hypothetical protein